MAVLIALVGTFFCLSMNIVFINDGTGIHKVYTLKSDIRSILGYAGYNDTYQVVDTQKDGNRLSIQVTPTFNVYVTCDGETRSVVMQECTVAQAVEAAGFVFGEKDMCNYDREDLLTKESYIDLVPYVEPQPEPEPQPVRVNPAPALATATDVSVTSTGATISTLTPDIDIPLDEDGLPIRYTSVTRVQATAYTYTGFRCSTGVNPQPGYIAVNPKVIPYGTKMYIVSADGRYTYGYAVAADTGGFIKSRPTNVDLFFTSEAACRAFGRRDVYIYFVY